MTIDPITGRLQNATVTKTSQRNSTEIDKSPTANKPSGDSIEITNNAARISKALVSASASPIIDNDRVAAVKQALADGNYSIDAQKIAQKMTQLDSLLNQDST